jgi:hypothetical protein
MVADRLLDSTGSLAAHLGCLYLEVVMTTASLSSSTTFGAITPAAVAETPSNTRHRGPVVDALVSAAHEAGEFFFVAPTRWISQS